MICIEKKNIQEKNRKKRKIYIKKKNDLYIVMVARCYCVYLYIVRQCAS